MYTIIDYYQLTNRQKTLFFDFLKEARKEVTQHAHGNMWEENWTEHNYTLPYLLECTDRFSASGKFNIVFDDKKVVGCSGVYTTSFCSDLAIAGTRTWIAKEYRNMSVAREFLLPAEKSWAISNGFKAIALCFNEYNKNMINIWKRTRIGEKRTPRLPHHIFYNGVIEVDFLVTIQYTNQWVIYEELSPSFDFDWTSIK